jgi:hypothetical protein
LKNLLAGSEKAMEVIAKNSRLFRDYSLDPLDKSGSAAARLLESNLDEVICGLADAHAWIAGELAYGPCDELKAAATVLVKSIQLIVPCRFDHGIVSGVRAHKLDGNATIIDLPCALATVAEIVMAGVDDRETSFRPRENDNHYPDGTRLLPAPPEFGIGTTREECEAIRESLERKFNPAGWRHLRERVDDYMITRFIDKTFGKTREAKVRTAAIELANQSGRNSSFYLIYRLPSDEQSRREMIDGLRELKKDYPALVLLGLTDDPDFENQERTQFGRFRNLLPKRS